LVFERSDMATVVTCANKIIFLAKAGERRPDALCGQVLKEIRGHSYVEAARVAL
jgi:hypothetical protein